MQAGRHRERGRGARPRRHRASRTGTRTRPRPGIAAPSRSGRRSCPGSAAEAEAYQRLGALRAPAQAARGGHAPLPEGARHPRRPAPAAGRNGRDTVPLRRPLRAVLPRDHRPAHGVGRTEEAFHVLERYRARAFLALLAERDLVFTRRPPGGAGPRAAGGARGIRPRVRRRWPAPPAPRAPRRAARWTTSAGGRGSRGPRPRRVAAPGRAPAPGAAGPRARRAPRWTRARSSCPIARRGARGYLFAVGPAARRLPRREAGHHAAEAARARSRASASCCRSGASLGRRPLRASAERLTAALLGPAADRISRAERVLILPDGPLHLVPFARPRRSHPGAGPLPRGGEAALHRGLGHRVRRAQEGAAGAPPRCASSPSATPTTGRRRPGAASIVRSLRERGLELPAPARLAPRRSRRWPACTGRARGPTSAPPPARSARGARAASRRCSTSRATRWPTRARRWTRRSSSPCPRPGRPGSPTACCRRGRSSSRSASTPTS